MIFLSAPSSQGFVCLQGPGLTSVKQLQVSLQQLAQVSGLASVDPGRADGVMDDRTVAATGAALRFAAPRAPTKALQVTLTALSVGLPFAPDAAAYLTKAAAEVSAAINLIIATTPRALAPPAPAVPWWQTTTGRGGLLAFAGILTVVLIMKRYRSGTPAAEAS